MTRSILAALCLALLARPLLADFDAEVNEPYHLKVVLHVARHRSLTPFFKDQLKRQLRDGLQAALGAMAHVEVVDRHPLLKQVEAEGLLALNGWKEISGDKLHFVLVDYVDGHYRIRTRQYDGSTGRASPAVRRRLLPDPSGRPQVARTVIRMIDLDLGLVGTVERGDEGPEVRVAIKGSGFLKKDGAQDPLARWIKQGDVFLLSKISQRAGTAQAEPVNWALLQVLEAPAGGVCRCHLYYRYWPNPLGASRGVLGVRCLKVHTVKERLRLRLINQKTHGAQASQQVAVSGDGFKSNSAENVSSDNNGIVQTNEAYENVAFVEIKTSGGTVAAGVPVAMLGQGVVSCPVDISKEAEVQGGLELQKRLLLRQVSDSLEVAGRLFEDLSRLVRDKKHDEARDKARQGLEDLKADLARAADERKAFLAGAKDLGFLKDVDLAEGEQRLFHELADRRKKLEDFINELETVIKKEKDPAIQEARGMIQQAQFLEEKAEYAEALVLYGKALAKLPESEARRKWQARADALRKDWALKSEAHQQARTFIYDQWPRLKTAQELKDNLGKARTHFDTCKQVGDRLTLRRLYLASSDQLTGLENELAPLKSRQGEDADKKRKMISETSEELYNFYKEVGKALQSTKAAKK